MEAKMLLFVSLCVVAKIATAMPEPGIKDVEGGYLTGRDCYYDDLRSHPSRCDRFLQCANNMEYDMPCQKGKVCMH